MSNGKSDMMSISATWGLIIYTGVFTFCSLEAVPGWGGLDLDLPLWLWVVAMGAVGSASGAMILEKRRRIGAFGGLIAGVCAMIFVGSMMQRADQVRAATLVLGGLIGSLPGIGIAALLNWFIGYREHADRREP